MKPSSVRGLEAAAVAMLLCLFAVQCVTSMKLKGITYDETTYYGIGKDILEEGSWQAPLATDQPPLSYYLHSLPLLGHEEDALGLRKRLAYPHLSAARRAMLPVALLLGLGVYLWSRSLMGPAAGLLSLALYATSPNMVAHARLITPDLTLSCFYFLAGYAVWIAFRRRSLAWTVLAGVLVGLAQLSKFTAALLVPSVVALGVVEAARRRLRVLDALKRLVIVGAVALVVLNAGYGFRGCMASLETHDPEGARFSKMADHGFLKHMPVPLPLNYTRGFTHQHSIVQAGFPSFLMGQHSNRGWWYYFLVALTIKTPPALHVALLTALVLCLACRTHPLRDRRADLPALLLPPAVLLLYASFLNHINIGLRYVLPVLPFMHVFAGAVVSGRTCARWPRRALGCGLAVWSLVSALSIHPHYLAYFNLYIGGPKNGYRYLIDSNLDWGQDKPLLDAYVQESQIPVKIEPGCEPRSGRIAVSVNTLQGIYGDTGECYRWLKSYEPVHYIGYSWLVYDVPDDTSDTEP